MYCSYFDLELFFDRNAPCTKSIRSQSAHDLVCGDLKLGCPLGEEGECEYRRSDFRNHFLEHNAVELPLEGDSISLQIRVNKRTRGVHPAAFLLEASFGRLVVVCRMTNVGLAFLVGGLRKSFETYSTEVRVCNLTCKDFSCFECKIFFQIANGPRWKSVTASLNLLRTLRSAAEKPENPLRPNLCLAAFEQEVYDRTPTEEVYTYVLDLNLLLRPPPY